MVRRAIDVAVTCLALVVTLPLLALVSLGILASVGPPVLFTQTRSGRGGTPFVIFKFRTMRPPRFPDEPDSARTPLFGRVLRAASIDELPQLWNVLIGDMSLIGPRPTLPEQVVHYSPRQRRRLEVRPGITGYAQVRVRNASSWPERIELDLWYLEHRSAWLDAKIVALTILRLLRPRGIVGEGGVNPGFPVPTADGIQSPGHPARSDA